MASTAADGRPCKPMSLNSRRGGAERSDAVGRPGGGGGAREPRRERQQRSYLASVYSIDEEYVFIILFAVINPVFRRLFFLTCRRLSVILASEKHAAHIVHPCGSFRASHCEDNRTNGAIFFYSVQPSRHTGRRVERAPVPHFCRLQSFTLVSPSSIPTSIVRGGVGAPSVAMSS